MTSGELIAQGGDASSAVFIQQKMYEAVGLPCVWGDSESWFHTNKYLRDFQHTLTIVYISKRDNGKERTLEALKRMDFMKRIYIVVTDDEMESDYVLHTPLLAHDIFFPDCGICSALSASVVSDRNQKRILQPRLCLPLL